MPLYAVIIGSVAAFFNFGAMYVSIKEDRPGRAVFYAALAAYCLTLVLGGVS